MVSFKPNIVKHGSSDFIEATQTELETVVGGIL